MPGDRIEKQIILKASLERTWRAISDPREFGAWFGAAFDGPFVAGQDVHGQIEPTTVDPVVARMQEPHRGTPFSIRIERVEPMRLLSFRWHPSATEPDRDYSAEPTTLVTFVLDEVADGVRLTITETGFDQLPEERRGPALDSNEGGWTHQARLIARYLAARP